MNSLARKNVVQKCKEEGQKESQGKCLNLM